MNIINIINKKRLNQSLTKEEIKYVISSYTNDKIKDYQMSALLMAICLNDMSDEEIISLTNSMLESGETITFSNIKQKIVDKHSTGGVGDKTTLIVVPLVASCGVKVAKMSGRSLGQTGGTIDKLEAIPNIKLKCSKTKFVCEIKKINAAIISQTKNLVPADKKIYALRDVTGTVESIPLIASSIMSKKIASGADAIVLDIKVGNGALIKNIEDAKRLASIAKSIANSHNKEVVSLITNMNIPLGKNIGNALEIKEAIDVLQNKGEKNLTNLCISLASNMVSLGLNISIAEAKVLVEKQLYNLKAYQKFEEIITYQQGNLNDLPKSTYQYEVKSKVNGFVNNIDASILANYVMNLGAGRKTKDDQIDYAVGIVLKKQINDYVNTNDTIAIVHSNKELKTFVDVEGAFTITSIKNNDFTLIYETIR